MVNLELHAAKDLSQWLPKSFSVAASSSQEDVYDRTWIQWMMYQLDFYLLIDWLILFIYSFFKVDGKAGHKLQYTYIKNSSS